MTVHFMWLMGFQAAYCEKNVNCLRLWKGRKFSVEYSGVKSEDIPKTNGDIGFL